MMKINHKDWRTHPFYQFDPYYHDIDPALLNSVDIKRYVNKGCLIAQTEFDPNRLKTASYEMKFLGTLFDWTDARNGRLTPRCRELKRGCEIVLPRNSISYLWMQEQLLLPEYIAARFNLHIRHVHKGILLGTGPLVDPGFSGSLLIPLHNLTDNDYTISGGDGIIWVEFTKLSRNSFWAEEEGKRPSDLEPFPDVKDLDDPHNYLRKSGVTTAGGVQSAFKGALVRAEGSAAGARREAAQFKRIGITAIVIGGLGIAVSIGGLWYSGYNLISRATDLAQKAQNELFDARIKEQDLKIEQLETKYMGRTREGSAEIESRDTNQEKPARNDADKTK